MQNIYIYMYVYVDIYNIFIYMIICTCSMCMYVYVSSQLCVYAGNWFLHVVAWIISLKVEINSTEIQSKWVYFEILLAYSTLEIGKEL